VTSELNETLQYVDSLILPISSREVVEGNIKAYKNCEISFDNLRFLLTRLDFSTPNPVAVSLIYPVSLLEERHACLSAL
jgi:hypothetical protein